jgi:hypothetical protein
MILHLVFFFIFLLPVGASVLEGPVLTPDYQQNPRAIEWSRITTEHFEIIFPAEVEEEAQRVSKLLEKIYFTVSRSLEVLPPRIPLVLQNQSVQSNGFVTLAPRRSEWFLTPAIDPELTNTEWLKTLAIHEFRHVVQFQKTRRGFNQFLEIILGEIGQALGLALTLPPWFYEGDAVGIETALTRGGRGRLPLFDRDLRTLLLSGKNWGYDKAHLGSFEDYIPNHYVYGYFYTSWLRNNYGDLFLSRIANQSAETSWNPLSFYNAIEHLTEEKFEDIYKAVINDLTQEWSERRKKLKVTSTDNLTKEKPMGWTNYYYPQGTLAGDIFALKKGLSFINEFVLLKKNGKEESLFFSGILHNEYPYKVRGDKIAYFEEEFDPRWGYRNFSRLRVFDLKTRSFIIDRRQTKGRLAVLDHEGKNLAYINWDEAQRQNLVILDETGKELFTINIAREKVVTSLDWTLGHELVLALRDRSDKKFIIKLNTDIKTEEILLGPRDENIGFLSVENDQIFFEGPESGIDNLYVLTNSGPRKITTSEFGAYAPDLIDNELVYNDYSVEGMNVVIKKSLALSQEESSGSFYPIYEKFSKAESLYALSDAQEEKKDFPVEPYSQLRQSLNLHSWVILAPPLSNTISLMGISRDILNKFSLMGGAEYNLNEQTLQGSVGATWSYWYPVFDLRAAYGGRRLERDDGTKKIEDRWEEGTFELGASVPWRYIQGRFIHQFTTRAFAKIIKVTNSLSQDQAELRDSALSSPGLEVSYSFFQRLARRDLNPVWGISFNGEAQEGNDISGEGQEGAFRSLDGRVYLPGFLPHHSFHHQMAYERQLPRSYKYASKILYPRGTKFTFLQEFTKYSGNYLLPLFYPDWNWSRYLYIKRISLNLFYDELNGRLGSLSYKAASTGWETIVDLNLARIFLPLSIGLRGSYIINGAEKAQNYELFLTSVVGSF